MLAKGSLVKEDMPLTSGGIFRRWSYRRLLNLWRLHIFSLCIFLWDMLHFRLVSKSALSIAERSSAAGFWRIRSSTFYGMPPPPSVFTRPVPYKWPAVIDCSSDPQFPSLNPPATNAMAGVSLWGLVVSAVTSSELTFCGMHLHRMVAFFISQTSITSLVSTLQWKHLPMCSKHGSNNWPHAPYCHSTAVDKLDTGFHDHCAKYIPTVLPSMPGLCVECSNLCCTLWSYSICLIL